ncbi:unnamed protein product [Eruca vesicaria subsp. sativa]|uniref:Uncharacterized protein n=1 Tax=Eruca vesicaria subsp. sativa TaxID=29727 RepID=A0ABC8JQQ7_ERUVS|nr:unnamed protein product [Eruca vesicaria subsp. sativa]
MGNNALSSMMTTLENISRKFDHYEGRFQTFESRLNANNSKLVDFTQNMDKIFIIVIVKASMDERLRVLGVGKSIEIYDNFSKVPEQYLQLPLPQPQSNQFPSQLQNTQQKSVNSRMLAKTPEELDKFNKVWGQKKFKSFGTTMPAKAVALDFFNISLARMLRLQPICAATGAGQNRRIRKYYKRRRPLPRRGQRLRERRRRRLSKKIKHAELKNQEATV